MTKYIYLAPLVFLHLLTVFAQTVVAVEPIQPSVSLPPKLAGVIADYESAWRGKDSAALARLFSEDGFVLSPGNPMVRGRKAIQRFYAGAGGPLSLRAVAFATEGNLGYIIGGFSPGFGLPDRGKFTLTLRRDPSGRWLIMSDMDNGNTRRS
jgi:ketosteroid isomerase-like protein